jgi:hypothetical protein
VEPDWEKAAIQAVVEAMVTEASAAARSLIVKAATTVRKRRAVKDRLDASAERVRNEPDQRFAEIDKLAKELKPFIQDLTSAQFEQIVKSISDLVAKAGPTVTNALTIKGDFLNFPQVGPVAAQAAELSTVISSFHRSGQSRQDSLVDQVAMMLRDGAAAQRAFASEIMTLNRVAEEKRKEAQTANNAVLMASLLVAELRLRIAELERERDELLDQLGEKARQGADVAELQRQLADAQQEVRDYSERYSQSQRDLVLYRRQREAAERRADEAVEAMSRVVYYEHALDDLIDDGERYQERSSGPGQALRGQALPAAPGIEERHGPRDGAAHVAPPGSPADGVVAEPRSSSRRSGSRARRTDRTAAARARWEVLKAIIGSTVLVGFIGCLLATYIYGIADTIRDDQYQLSNLYASGAKPATTYYTPPGCDYGCADEATQYLTFRLRSDQATQSVFQVGDHRDRYLNVTNFSLANVRRACGSSPSVRYSVYSNGRLINSGKITTKNDASISNLPIGRHALLRLTALLHAPGGCVLGLQMSNATVDALKGGANGPW